MKRLNKYTVTLWLSAALILPGASADAVPLGTVDIYRSGHGANTGVNVWAGGLSGTEMYAGVYMLQKTGGTGAGLYWPNGTIGAMCMEPEQPAPDFGTTYNVEVPADNYNPVLSEFLGTAKADYLGELWGRYYDPSWQQAGPYSPSENNAASAFATAVWEIVYENEPISPLLWDVSTDGSPGINGFASLGADAGLSNSWLHSLDGTGPKATLAVFTHANGQNFLVQVPEPTTIALFGLGGMFSIMRRRRRTA
ncbi:PEP-CTERM sorting domain-containing protein [Planctomycetota bacterium]